MLGQHVVTLVQGKRQVGKYELVWNGRDEFGVPVPSGVYLVNMRADGFVQSRKIVLMG